MLFTVKRILQLAVSVNLCLLMVVISDAVPSMVRLVRLHNDCSSSVLQVDLQGRVYAWEDPIQEFSNLKLQSLSFGRLTIFAEKAGRYVCYTRRWKLVGSKRNRGERCEFEETMTNGFNQYRSVANSSYAIGFSAKGLPLKGPKTVLTGGRGGNRFERCTWFSKLGQLSQDIVKHNRGDHPGPGPMRIGQLPPFVGKAGSFLSASNNDGLNNSNPSLSDNQLKKKKRKKVPSERLIDVITSAPSAVQIQPKHSHRHSKNKNHLRNS